MAKKIEKDLQFTEKKIRELRKKEFACIADAKRAAARLLKKAKYHEIVDITIKAKESGKGKDSLKNISYKVELITIAVALEKVERERRQAGRFILATNVRL